jgi:tungstate transport system substrate-binding protein
MASWRNTTLAFIALVGVATFSGQGVAQEKSIVVASTTSARDTGLFDYLLPIFKQKTGIAVKIIALGTGQALETGRRGDADVVFVHAKPMEVGFIAEGYGVKRYPVMYNDFVLIGPKSDPAGIRGTRYAADALQMIKEKQSLFISRGDRSGTHLTELMLWNRDAGINIEKEKGAWYIPIGRGMSAALKTAAAMAAYVLSDRSTWISFKEQRGDLEILVQGDKHLFNQYSVILVNPAKYPNVKEGLGREFIDWLVSLDGQQTIANYKINGEQLFFPNATDSNA